MSAEEVVLSILRPQPPDSCRAIEYPQVLVATVQGRSNTFPFLHYNPENPHYG